MRILATLLALTLPTLAFDLQPTNTVLRVGGIRLGNCQSNETGMLRYNGGVQVYDGSAWRSLDQPGAYPVFCIDLANTGFTELELKASTNNFQSVQYWFDSLGQSFTAWWNHSVADRDCMLWFSRHPTSVTNRNPAVVVMPSATTVGGSCTAWMTSANTSMVWSYRRRNAVEHEDAWHPIWPTAWVVSRPAVPTVDDERAWRVWDPASTLTEQLGYVPTTEGNVLGGGRLFVLPGDTNLYFVDVLGTTNTLLRGSP